MLNVIILAAGQGTRMRSDLPKVLHPIAGKPMLAHVIDAAKDLNPDNIIVVVGHGADTVKDRFADKGVQFVYQEHQLGTAHAVKQAMPLVPEGSNSDTCIVLYGDVPLIQPDTLKTLLQTRQTGLALLTENMANPYGYGRIVRNSQGVIKYIVEQKDANETELAIKEINTGILAAPVAALRRWLGLINNNNAQGEFYLTDIVSLAVADNIPVTSAQPAKSWETFGVNSRQQQAQLERLWQTEQAERLLAQGVSMADPARFDLRGSLTCGKDVFIDVGCVFEGKVVLGDGVHIAPYCIISDASIAANTTIQAYTHIQGARVAANAQIGPYARLRPGADIGENAHVGNFVELKKTKLGTGSKANHLSYLGDAIIGDQVNIGAGTITCNYDGVNKFQTIIEDGAFIGSDTQLVAPVRVGAGATIGAGTTLTRSAPAGQLTISRVKQQSIDGWQKPTSKK